jgi:hypothetical protein
MLDPEGECGSMTTAEERHQDEFPRDNKWAGWSEYLNDPGERNGCGVVEEGTPNGCMLETCLM